MGDIEGVVDGSAVGELDGLEVVGVLEGKAVVGMLEGLAEAKVGN